MGYVSFYHLFFKGVGVDKGVEAMRVASGDSNFVVMSGPSAKASWISYMRTQSTEQLGRNLQLAAHQVQQLGSEN